MESQKVESLEEASTVWYSEEESWYLRIVYMEIGAVYRSSQRLLIPHSFFFKSQSTIILFLWPSKVLSCHSWMHASSMGFHRLQGGEQLPEPWPGRVPVSSHTHFMMSENLNIWSHFLWYLSKVCYARRKAVNQQWLRQPGEPGMSGLMGITGLHVGEVTYCMPRQESGANSDGWIFHMEHEDNGAACGQQTIISKSTLTTYTRFHGKWSNDMLLEKDYLYLKGESGSKCH